MSRQRPKRETQSARLTTILAIGFVGLAIGLLTANSHQPTAYELSIYRGAPIGFWIGISLAMAASLVVAIISTTHWVRTVAMILGGMVISAIAGLPLLRGYYFYGTADALTHLGWARDLMTASMDPIDIFYPGIHSVATLIATFAGIEVTRAILVVVTSMVVLTLLFVPLTVRVLTRNDRTVIISAFSVFLLFMVHNLGIYLHPHAFAQATFFSALVIFLVTLYITRFGSRPIQGGLLLIASVAAIVYHPQVATNLLLVFVAISLVQIFYRRYESDHPIAGHRVLYGHTVLFALLLGIWIIQFERARNNVDRIQDSIQAYIEGSPPIAGEMARTQSASLTAIGAGIPEIFVKLFLVASIFTVLAGILMAISIRRFDDTSQSTVNAFATYFGVASVMIFLLVVIYFVGNIAEHYFRHIGFLLLIATIVGSLTLARGFEQLSCRYDPRWAKVAVIVFFTLLLPLSLATAYPSPFIYKQSQHVTESQVDGYETVFEIHDETLTLAGIRRGPFRYSDAIHGVTASRNYKDTVANDGLTNLVGIYDEGGYLIVTENDHSREVRAYKELRYSDQAFRSLNAQEDVNLVVSNDAVQLYHVSEGDV